MPLCIIFREHEGKHFTCFALKDTFTDYPQLTNPNLSINDIEDTSKDISKCFVYGYSNLVWFVQPDKTVDSVVIANDTGSIATVSLFNKMIRSRAHGVVTIKKKA